MMIIFKLVLLYDIIYTKVMKMFSYIFKRIIFLLIFLLSINNVFARSHGDHLAYFSKLVINKAVPITTSLKKPVCIALVYPAKQEPSTYWTDSVAAIRGRMSDLKIETEFHEYFTIRTDYIQQIKYIQKAVENGCEYIVVSTDNPGVVKFLEPILKKKKSKIIVQNYTREIKQWGQYQPFLYTGFDHYLGSKILVEELIARYPAGGNYITLKGSNGFVGNERYKGFAENIPSIFKEVGKYITDFDFTLAYNATRDAFKHSKKIDFIFASSTALALGAVKAVNEVGLKGQIVINGWGGTPKEIEALKQKDIQFTVMRMTDDSSVAIAEAIKLDQEGKSDLIPHIYFGEFEVIDSENIENIEKLIKRAFRYSQ